MTAPTTTGGDVNASADRAKDSPTAATPSAAGVPASPPLITEPGVYDGIPEDVYHSDPVPGRSLSFSGAKRLLPPSCPAIFRWEQLHGRPNKPAFDFGHAAHAEVLGIGAPLVVVDAADWRTKAAQAQRDEAYAAGHTPILAHEHQQVKGMAEALRAHPIASALFDPDRGGKPEQSLFWHDERHDVMRRSRLDWLPATRDDGRLILPDYKTTTCAAPSALAKTVANFSYHQQAAWYPDMVVGLGLAEQVAFVFVFQEKTAPYLVTVVELDALSVRVGRHLNDRALEVYAECSATDTWPGYTDDVELISLPSWVINQHLDVA